MICDITNRLEADPNIQQTHEETRGLAECTQDENGLYVRYSFFTYCS